MVTMSRLNRDFQQSLLRARFLHLMMKHAWESNRRPAACQADVLTTTLSASDSLGASFAYQVTAFTLQ